MLVIFNRPVGCHGNCTLLILRHCCYARDKQPLIEPKKLVNLTEFAEASVTIKSDNNHSVSDTNDAFAAVVHNIRGTYCLQYCSEQTADNNKLGLLAKVSERDARLQHLN